MTFVNCMYIHPYLYVHTILTLISYLRQIIRRTYIIEKDRVFYKIGTLTLLKWY